jgi:hypothetical protein
MELEKVLTGSMTTPAKAAYERNKTEELTVCRLHVGTDWRAQVDFFVADGWSADPT